MELMSYAHAENLCVRDDGRQALFFQVVLVWILDEDEPAGGDDGVPERGGAWAGFVGGGVVE